MNSSPHGQWVFEPPVVFQSLDGATAGGFYADLPPIPENDQWDHGNGWGVGATIQSNDYLSTGQIVAQSSGDGSVNAPSLQQGLSDLLARVQELQSTVAELQVIICGRLDAMDRRIAATQRYLDKLVAWSTKLQENLSRLPDIMPTTQQCQGQTEAGGGE